MRLNQLFVLSFLVTSIWITNPAISATVDSLDFSIDGQGSTHDTVGDSIESSPISGGSSPNGWTLTFGSVASDTTTNEFITTGGIMRIQDWGGEGTVTASSWTAVEDGSIDISGVATAIASGQAFNSAGEGFTWFYDINGASFSSGLLGNVTAMDGDDLSFTFANLPVFSGDVVTYGFTVNVDGANDGAEVSSQLIDFQAAAVPEPNSVALVAALACMGGIRRYRHRRTDRFNI